MVLYNEGKPVDAREMMICCAADKHAHSALKWEHNNPLPTEELKPNTETFYASYLFYVHS